MPEYLHPGVYIEESRLAGKPIEGVSTDTAAFLGASARGPVRPRLVTSVSEYLRWFGAATASGQFLPDAVGGFFANGGRRLFVCRIASRSATTAQADFGPHFALRATGPGTWGTRIFALVGASSTQVTAGGVAVPIGVRLRLAYYDAEPAGDPSGWFAGSAGAPVPDHSEDFDDLVFDEASSDRWRKSLERSSLVTLLRSSDAPVGARPATAFRRLGAGGSDGAPSLEPADFEGSPTTPRDEPQGLAALTLEPYRDVALVYAPGVPYDIARLVVRHCEDARFRFAIVDAGPSTMPPDFAPQAAVADSKHAAFYYPWLIVNDAFGGLPQKTVPPGGHVAGVYARVARERGIHKAPANETVRGALGVTAAVTDAAQATFSARHVNVIRDFHGRGIRIWGARTLSSDPEWRYVSVRRLFIYIERSIVEGTQWVAFEHNDEAAWTRFSADVRLFLRRCWQDGALAGATEEEAFFVRCDRTTMSADDILNGRLICVVGAAPTRPAEFVIFRIFQQANRP